MINICFRDLYLIFLTIVIFYLLYKNNEPFQGTTTSGYQADVEAIRNLSSIATQLTTNNTLTMPGALTVTNNLTANNSIILPNAKPVIDLGAGDSTREVNAGKIAYNVWDDSLSIVGKGKSGESRRTTMWDNVKVTNRFSTNNLDPNNIPDGWGGGIRTNDIYSSGAIGCGATGKDVKASINRHGDAIFSGNLSVGNNVTVGNSVTAKNFCIGGTCINENHLKILTTSTFPGDTKINGSLKVDGNIDFVNHEDRSKYYRLYGTNTRFIVNYQDKNTWFANVNKTWQ